MSRHHREPSRRSVTSDRLANVFTSVVLVCAIGLVVAIFVRLIVWVAP